MRNYVAQYSGFRYHLAHEPGGYVFRRHGDNSGNGGGHSGYHSTENRCIQHALEQRFTTIIDEDTLQPVTLESFNAELAVQGVQFIAIYHNKVYTLKKTTSRTPFLFDSNDGGASLDGSHESLPGCIRSALQASADVVIVDLVANKLVKEVVVETKIIHH